MSGLEIVGVVVGVVPVVFQGIIKTWKTLDDTISFDGDTEDIVIRLETVKAHLGIWAAKTGLTQGELVSDLNPFEELIERTLKRIGDLMSEVEKEGNKYGIVVEEIGESKTKKSPAAIVQMRRSLRSIITSSKSKSDVTTRPEKEASSQSKTQQGEVSSSRKVYWAIHDKQKFETFVNMLEKHVSGLQAFVVERERRDIQQDGARLALEIIQNLSEPDALSPLRHASGWNQDFSQLDVHALAQWKSIMLQKAPTFGTSASEREDWSLAGSSAEDRLKTHFLKKGRIDPETIYLFEKKEYDMNISDDLKDNLRERIRKLVSLLGGTGAKRRLHTLQAVGYMDDADFHCWWIVFQFPLDPLNSSELKTSEPLSLRALYTFPSKPALEIRYGLAKRLVDTFARLYGSDWMHKGINSSNIIFPQIHASTSGGDFSFLNKALVQGFNYSRQLTQAQTIDRGKVLNDLEAAIYRHPHYQGEAASGYQIHYDIYSLGLVLFEIAVWGPLMDFLVAKLRPGKETPVALSPYMNQFHEAEAIELKRRVVMRVDNELAYRVGTAYRDMVQWCINLNGPVTALEFYNKVAVPLEELCGLG